MSAIDAPIFVTGRARSGTTLVQRLLSAHPRLNIVYESFLASPRFAVPADIAAPGVLDSYWTNYLRQRTPGVLGIDAARTLSRVRAMGPPWQRSLLAAVMEDAAETAGKARGGDKSPGSYRALPQLFTWFPRARVVWVMRDPRATVASHLRQDEAGPKQSAADIARMWTGAARNFRETWQNDERVMLVRYEDVVAEPEAAMRRACVFLGEDYTSAMLADPGNNSRFGLEGTAVSTEPIARWRRVLSPADAARIERIARDEMRPLGYAETASGSLRDRARRLLGRRSS